MIRATLAVQPTPTKGRNFTLDALRGFALLGVIIANMPSFSWTYWSNVKNEQIWPAVHDVATVWALRWLIWGKFNSLFSLLFGVGFAIQVERLGRSGRSPVPAYLHRLGVLLVFGLLHAVWIWHGDVLLTYAEIGIILLLIRKVPTGWILPAALVSLLALPAIEAVNVARTSLAEAQTRFEEHLGRQRAEDVAYARGSYLDTVAVRAKALKLKFAGPREQVETAGGLLAMLGTTLFGLFAVRRKLLMEPHNHLSFWRRTLLGALGVGIVALIGLSYFRTIRQPGVPSAYDAGLILCFCIQRPAIMLVYLSGLVLLLQRADVRRWMAPVATMGRMPLTNYLAHSLVFTTVFYHYGLGYYNQVGPAVCSALAIGLWVILLGLSQVWLARFEYGPLEWVWKLVTYAGERSSAESRVRAAASIDPTPVS